MKSIEEIKEELKNLLSEKRYLHSIGVMEKAIELANMYKLPLIELKKDNQ